MRLTFPVLLAIALSPALDPVFARSIPHAVGNEHSASTLPWSDVVHVRAFDPNAGVLLRVHLSIDTFVRADMAAENLAAVPMALSAHAVAVVSVQGPRGDLLAQAPFQTDEVWTVAPFDGAVDFAGASGRRANSIGRQHIDVVVDDPAALLAFVGVPGQGGLVDLPVSAFGSTMLVGGPDVAQRTRLDAGVRVRVAYETVSGH